MVEKNPGRNSVKTTGRGLFILGRVIGLLLDGEDRSGAPPFHFGEVIGVSPRRKHAELTGQLWLQLVGKGVRARG